MCNWVVPILHIKLGLANYIVILDRIFEFSLEHLEKLDAHILNKHTDIVTNKAALRANMLVQKQQPSDALKAQISAQKLQNTKLVSEHRLMISRRKNRPMEHAIERVLSEYDIARQAFHSHTLIGEHVHRLLSNHVDICLGIGEAMYNPTNRKLDVLPEVNETIDVFLGKIQKLLQALDVICSMMAQTTPLNEEQCTDFALFCPYFGDLWRHTFPNNHVPIKLHILETHAPLQMTKWRILGVLGEDPIERLHHDQKKMAALLKNMKSFRAIQEAGLNRTNNARHPLSESSKQVAMDGTKRILSPESKLKRKDALEQTSTVKKQKQTQLRMVVNLHNNT